MYLQSLHVELVSTAVESVKRLNFQDFNSLCTSFLLIYVAFALLLTVINKYKLNHHKPQWLPAFKTSCSV